MSEYLFVKPGLSGGGASFADILTSAALREETGEKTRFLTGFCSPLAAAVLGRCGVELHVDPLLDREAGESPDVVAETVLKHANDKSRLILSQFFAKKEAILGGAAVGLAQRLPTAIRMHNYIAPESEEAFSSLPDSAIQLPIHDYMASRMQQLQPANDGLTIPPIFDTERFTNNLPSRIVRQELDVEPNDILVVQPTVLAARKAPETSLYLARDLARETGRRTVMLFSGNTNIPEGAEIAERLRALNEDLGVECLFDGARISRFNNTRRVGDLLNAADLTSMPSYQDDVMLTIAEASFVQKPIYTRAFVDGNGAPLYDVFHSSLDALVQRDMNAHPDPALVAEAVAVVQGERRLDVKGNARYTTKRFTAKGIAPQLKRLHALFSQQV